MLAAYVTGHGYGHATRTAEVLRQVRRLRPELPIRVATSAPARLFHNVIAGPLEIRHLACDVGVAQRGALVIDEAATADAWEVFERDDAQRVADEAERLRGSGARVVLGDIPPLAFAAAARAGVPSVGVTNFSWDWIWRHLAAREPRLLAAADAAAASYAKATLLLALPFAGDLAAFPRREEVPLVARRPTLPRGEVRRRLGVATDHPVVLLSFGGLGLQGLEPRSFAGLEGFHFLAQDVDAVPSNMTAFSNEGLDRLAVGYEDLVAASDAVVSKPGYGIVTDCIGARTRLLYTDRGDFPEYPILVAGMANLLPCMWISHDTLFSAQLGNPLAELLARPWPDVPRLDGAEVVARRLLEVGGL